MAFFGLAMLLQTALPASSPPPPPPLHGGPQDMTCPVGGEHFSAWRPTMFSTYGERPDGKPYSYLPFPFPLPECPTNKLIMFDDYSESEVAALSRLIEMADYKRLVGSETTYYRAYWLATRLGRPEPEALGLLLSAIWQVSPGELTGRGTAESAVQFRRYQQIFINKVRHLKPSIVGKDRVWLEARAANAARQLGRFDAAEELRRRALASLGKVADKGGWNRYLTLLATVIARRDDSIEPLDMIPQQQIAWACASRKPAHAFDRAVCAKLNVSARVPNLGK